MMRMRAVLVTLTSAILAATGMHAQSRMELVPSVSFSTTYDDNIFTTEQGSGDAGRMTFLLDGTQTDELVP